jgi:hypothetical protein
MTASHCLFLLGSEAPRRLGLEDEVTELAAGVQGFQVYRVEDQGDVR